jgi:hypothetical protein
MGLEELFLSRTNLKRMKNVLMISLLTIAGFVSNAQSRTGYLTDDGAWCWFSDPRAIMVDDHIVSGWVKSDGTIEACMFNIETDRAQFDELYYKLQTDDHNNPAFALTTEGTLIAMYTRHSMKDLFINTSIPFRDGFKFSGAQLIHPISDEEFEKFPRRTITYANPIPLEEEHRIYCFGRWAGFKPNMMWSDDAGRTWSKSRVFITNYPFNNNNRPYVKYFSDGKSRIHIVFTDGHPRDEPTNSVYYAYYEGGAFYKATGERICTMDQIPFEPKDASIIYKPDPDEGRAWIADIGQDKQYHPVILFTKSPTEINHEYWYARFTRRGWSVHKICDSGRWFPRTPEGQKEPEPHYFGGMTLHPDHADVVYLSRKVNGVFEIERWETGDSGNSWTSEAVTENSDEDNVRPFVPRGLKAGAEEIVLWMENQKYIHYTNYQSSIKYFIRY